MSELTKNINSKNIKSVREQINAKNSHLPYIASEGNAIASVTDMDHFPYTRYFRGVYYNTEPVIFEREAGYRPHQNKCYKVKCKKNISPYPNHCFQTACSTLFLIILI